MSFIITGVLFIILAIGLVISSFRSKQDKVFKLFNLKEDDYEIIDKQRFNSIMTAQELSIAIWIFIIGILCMIIKSPMLFLLPSLSFLISIPFSLKAKKYIKME